LQDRSIKEMRLLGINSYQEGNRYLPKFIHDHNRRFAVQPASELNSHHPLDETIGLDYLFSIHDFCIITNTLQIACAGKVYQIVTNHPAYYPEQEVFYTNDASVAVSAWYHANLLNQMEIEK